MKHPAHQEAPTREQHEGAVYESVLSHASTLLYRCRFDAHYTMLLLGGPVKRLLGYERRDLLENRKIAFAELIHPDDGATVDAAVAAGCNRRHPWEFDYRIRTHSGAYKWIHESGGAVYGTDGAVLYLEGVLQDIDARKQQELARTEQANRVGHIGDNLVGNAEQILRLLRSLRMLSLNARMEAARAGEMGLGFAAVAGEVNALARQTAPLAEAISDLARALETELETQSEGHAQDMPRISYG